MVLTYTILSGDRFATIAEGLSQSDGLTDQEMVKANPTIDPRDLKVGELVTIPATSNPPPHIVPAPHRGYWDWTWGPGSTLPDATFGIAFSGNADPTLAIQQSADRKDSLLGEKYISLGEGPSPMARSPVRSFGE